MKFFAVLILTAICSCSAKKEIIFPDGGYAFVTPDGSDPAFPYYPIKKMLEPDDSFYCSYYESKLLNAFDEPNISVRPSATPIIRITYDISVGPAYIITLEEDKIIVKKSLNGMFNQDEKNLSAVEFDHLSLLQGSFPIGRNKKNRRLSAKKYADSMVKSYPRLMDPEYYKSLLDKFNAPPLEPFKYSTGSTPISYDQYYHCIDEINKSGYWKLPFPLPHCKTPPMDGSGFSLEINTGKRYNYVSTSNCVTGYKEYGNACQKILDLAQINKNEINIIGLFSNPE